MKKEKLYTESEKPLKQFRLSDFLSSNEVFHISRVTINTSRDLIYHTHHYAELFWIESGEGIHHINGEYLPLHENELIMIRPSDTHNFTAKGGHLTLINIAFPQESLDYFKQRYFPHTHFYFWTKNKQPFQLTLPQELIKRFSARAEETMRYKRSYLQLDSLLLFIFRQLSDNESGFIETNAPLWLTSAIRQYNKEQLFKEGTEGFVRLCNRNSDYINRVIKEYFHHTLTEFINDIRINYAANQLLLTNIPIKSISNASGFNSLAHFYKLFKYKYQVSPLKYREIHQRFI